MFDNLQLINAVVQSIPMQQDYVPNMDMYGSSSSATSVAAAGM